MMTNQSFQCFLYEFYQTPKGQSLLREERRLIDYSLEQVFGLYLVQLGIPSANDLLKNNRVSHKILANDVSLYVTGQSSFVQANIDYLPFKPDSIDAVVMPHTLETVEDPYHLLRQVDKMLIGEGHLLLTGFNPFSCQMVRQRFSENRQAFKHANLLRAHRIIDWLNLLGYDIEMIHYSSISCLHQPDKEATTTLATWTKKLDQALSRGGIELGAVYAILAKKRIASPTPVGLNWRLSNWLPMKKRRSVATASQTNSHLENQSSVIAQPKAKKEITASCKK